MTRVCSALPWPTINTRSPPRRRCAMGPDQAGSTQQAACCGDSPCGSSARGTPWQRRSMGMNRPAFASAGGGSASKARRQACTAASPNVATASSRVRPVTAPQCRSLSCQSSSCGTPSQPSASSSNQVERMQRSNTDENTPSNSTPTARSAPAAWRIHCASRSVRSTSAQPVKRRSRFHSDSPWRGRIGCCMDTGTAPSARQGGGRVGQPAPPTTSISSGTLM